VSARAQEVKNQACAAPAGKTGAATGATDVSEIFGIPVAVILGQLTLGLVNGSFYALLSLGLAVIFGLMGVVNFAHGAFYTLGAFAALLGLQYFGINYWAALLLAPLAVGLVGIIVERLFLRHLYQLDPLYGLLLTFGLALIVEGSLHQVFGATGQSYPVPDSLSGVLNLHFMFLPLYRAWVIVASVVVCLGTWFVIERTSLGATLRAATENAPLLQAFGVNVPLLKAATYGGGVALAALAGVLASPVVLVNSHMGTSLVIVVFAVVVIGGMGSILGAIVTGLALGVIEGFTKVIYPEASNIVVFIIMALVLMIRPAGLFGRE
jgi:branched-chain amino acid transport system permease protein